MPLGAEGLAGLVVAASRRFAHHFGSQLTFDQPFSLACSTSIPKQVGLAGSSAIIIATLRALAAQFDLDIPPFELSEIALATEVEDLDIAAGPMDRVIQSYEGVMEMDLAPPRSETAYRRVDPNLLPTILIAWDPHEGISSGVPHGDLRERWRRGDEVVLDTIRELRNVVDRGTIALENGDHETFFDLVNHNFELRCRIFPVRERDRQMVNIARDLGAAGKLCGSGGAVLVVPRGNADLSAFSHAFAAAGYRTCRLLIT